MVVVVGGRVGRSDVRVSTVVVVVVEVGTVFVNGGGGEMKYCDET